MSPLCSIKVYQLLINKLCLFFLTTKAVKLKVLQWLSFCSNIKVGLYHTFYSQKTMPVHLCILKYFLYLYHHAFSIAAHTIEHPELKKVTWNPSFHILSFLFDTQWKEDRKTKSYILIIACIQVLFQNVKLNSLRCFLLQCFKVKH